MERAVDSPSGATAARPWRRACYQCDLLLTRALAPEGTKLLCPRCGAALHTHFPHSILYTAIYSFTGLLLFLPAATLPLLHFSFYVFDADNTLFNGVASLFGEGYIWLATLVLFCSVLAPLGKFLLLSFICWGCGWGKLARPVASALRWYQHLYKWGMLDVYLLGILVALVKMTDLGSISVEPGLYCFSAMMLMATATAISFDPEAVWSRLASAEGQRVAGTSGEPDL
ncbi:MAG: paraquat-inducible protein A [Gammaproteobacteria bacterium]|nr:paraquat-inducible protein A [Gammaproteobacteria bacterium]